MKRLIFFGNEKLASGVEEDGRLLNTLLDEGYDVSHVVVSQAEQRGRKKSDTAVLDIAKQRGIDVVTEWDKKRMPDLIASSGAQFGVLAAFGKIIPEPIINSFENGILNLHPSLLPQYRGSTPIESAILEGQPLTGISIMSLVKEMDAGPVYGFSEIKISDEMSKQYIYEQLLEIGSGMLIELLPGILEGKITPLKQDDSAASYCSTLSRENSELDFSKTALRLSREVRAYLGWPGSKTVLGGREVTVTKASVSALEGPVGKATEHEGNILIYCSDGALVVESLKPAGKKEMPAKAFLAGNSLD